MSCQSPISHAMLGADGRVSPDPRRGACTELGAEPADRGMPERGGDPPASQQLAFVVIRIIRVIFLCLLALQDVWQGRGYALLPIRREKPGSRGGLWR